MNLESLLERAHTYSAFADHQHHLATDADLDAVVNAAQALVSSGQARSVTIFDDASGRRTEVDPGSGPEHVRHYLQPASAERTGPGRPKLGVISREVTLLPRHWDWLANQSGGASAALRRLVEEVRKQRQAQEASRVAHDALARAMNELAGDQPGFEEALRALYKHEFGGLRTLLSTWPHGLRSHFERLASIAAELHTLALREASPQPDFVYSIVIASSREKVWQALTHPDQSCQWSGRRAESEWTVDSEVRYRKADGALDGVRARVLELDLFQRLVLRWADEAGPATRLSFELSSEDEVALTVTHQVDEPGSVVDPALREGWPVLLSSLKSWLETGRALKAALGRAGEGR